MVNSQSNCRVALLQQDIPILMNIKHSVCIMEEVVLLWIKCVATERYCLAATKLRAIPPKLKNPIFAV